MNSLSRVEAEDDGCGSAVELEMKLLRGGAWWRSRRR